MFDHFSMCCRLCLSFWHCCSPFFPSTVLHWRFHGLLSGCWYWRCAAVSESAWSVYARPIPPHPRWMLHNPWSDFEQMSQLLSFGPVLQLLDFARHRTIQQIKLMMRNELNSQQQLGQNCFSVNFTNNNNNSKTMKHALNPHQQVKFILFGFLFFFQYPCWAVAMLSTKEISRTSC